MIRERIFASFLVFVPLVLHAVPGQACRMAPAGQMISVEQLIGLATDVAVGQVISATPMDGHNVEYRFLVLEQLAGQPGKVLTVMGRPAAPGDQETTFNDHADFAFWARGGGRVMNGADCILHPHFVIGNTYLVFLGMPLTRRSSEQINMANGTVNEDDRWLKYVKQQLAKRQAPDSTATSDTHELGRDFERVGRFIYRFHRVVARDDLERKTLAGRHAPAELLQRAGRLADAFDHIVGSNTISDAEIDATLAEAVAVEKMLVAWSDSGGGVKQATR
jgi:hypothetical protein